MCEKSWITLRVAKVGLRRNRRCQREVQRLPFTLGNYDFLRDSPGFKMTGFNDVSPRRQAGWKTKRSFVVGDGEERMFHDGDIAELPWVDVAFQSDKNLRRGKGLLYVLSAPGEPVIEQIVDPRSETSAWRHQGKIECPIAAIGFGCAEDVLHERVLVEEPDDLVGPHTCDVRLDLAAVESHYC